MLNFSALVPLPPINFPFSTQISWAERNSLSSPPRSSARAKFKLLEGHHPRGTTPREALQANLPLRGFSGGPCGGLFDGSAGSSRGSAGLCGGPQDFPRVVTYPCDPGPNCPLEGPLHPSLQLEDPSFKPQPLPHDPFPPSSPPPPLALFAMLQEGAAQAGVGRRVLRHKWV